MPLNEAPPYRSNLTREQQQQAEAAIYNVPTPQNTMTPTIDINNLTAAQIELLRTVVQQHDAQHNSIASFDLNKPPREMTNPGAQGLYRFQEYPRMIYDHAKRESRVVQNRDQLEVWLSRGYSLEPLPPEAEEAAVDPFPGLDPQSAAEAAAIDEQLKRKRK